LKNSLYALKNIPSQAIDLIVTDPPFAIEFSAKKSNYNRKADNVMDGYAEISSKNYLSFSQTWISESYRILKETGSIYIVSGWTNLKDILIAIEEAGFHVLNHIIWKYQFGVFTKKRFVTSHYHIILAVKNKSKYFFNKIEHYPEDVWFIKCEYWRGRPKTPTKLPEKLVEKMILYSSQTEWLVLDPFVGSGTVPFVAKKLGRKFLGFEVVPDYYEFALKRISSLLQF